MSKLQSMYKDGKIGIVQNVGYAQPNFSHFRSIDIWLTGADYGEVLQTGWLGRYLDQEYPGFPTGYPSASMPDPIAIQIGSAVTLGLQGQNGNMGMAFSDPTAFSNVITGATGNVPNTRAGHELGYLRSVGTQLQAFATPVKNAATKGKTLSPQWPNGGTNSLADQLRIVAQLIAGGLKTKIYVVNLGGFDSHTDQRKGQDPLLLMLSNAVSAFQDELKLNAIEDRVIGMTFSEFGRRIKSNDSGGTDHGTAAPLFVFGTQVVPGVTGNNPVLPANATVDDNLAMEFDFRQIYASVLKEWLSASDAEITNTLLKQYTTLPIIKPQSGVSTEASPEPLSLSQNYPNPSGGSGLPSATNITFRTPGGQTTLRVIDIRGEVVSTLVDGNVATGEQTVTLPTGNLAAGTYLYRLEWASESIVKQMVVLR
jgi:uncharacterized protein (DUF1501 family)